MPPSPSLRRSPRREPCVDSHKRGRSLESGLSFKEKDDDLALFNEMESRETENFLLQPTDDFEDIFSSKKKPFPDCKLGINIPTRGESSDLLNADGDKNDYDWLLTPPDTPLFPSLDDEPAPVNLVHSGRARSRPISISRSSTMERSQRSSRGSPSPQRLSPSPRSGSSSFQGRPSSAPHSSAIPLRPTTPSRRPSPPPVKPSTPPPRSLTPTSRRTSVGSGGSVITSGLRGTSPVRSSRGNSASPKIKAWQSNIPGFSLEAPPNLRTSLADRPASYVRGSSPASRTSRDSSSKFGRQSMSPTASRSISSSHSQERDRLSSHSKGSLASSGDDDADSVQSIPVSVSERPMSRKGVGGFPSSKPYGFSKKPTKTYAPSSAPKRSFDSAMRLQMDRKSPQNMFRPLLSSVPSSTLYAGKSSSAHHTLISRNSSITTSSNASSDQATSGAHDNEGSDQYQDDMASECARTPSSDVQDEVFAFDNMDVRIEVTAPEARDPLSEVQREPDKRYPIASNRGDPEESSFHVRDVATGVISEVVDVQGDFVEIESRENTLLCSICGCHYHDDIHIESECNICPECKGKEESSGSISHTAQHGENTLESRDHENQPSQGCLENPLQVPSHTANSSGEMHKWSDKSDRDIDDVAEGGGISVLLLKRSSSVKGPLIHGRTINSSAISYDDLSYVRDLTSSVRSSVGHGSMSTSSSMDLSLAKHGEIVVQRQLSGRRSDMSSKPQSTESSFSGAKHEENYDYSHIVAGKTRGSSSNQVLALENSEVHDSVPFVTRAPLCEDDNADIHTSCREKDAFVKTGENSQGSIGIHEGHVMQEIEEDQNIEESGFLESSLAEENTTPPNRVDQMEVSGDDPSKCSLSKMSEIEIDDSHPSSPGSQIDAPSREDLEDHSAAIHCDIDVEDLPLESIELGNAGGILEDSTVTMEDQEGKTTRSLTLEEATDTILFCSSIIHDLAYNAASIAIEKEKENLEPLEGSKLTPTIIEKRSSDAKHLHGRTTRRVPKVQKARKSRSETPPETEAKPALTKNDERPDQKPVVRNVGLPNNGDSMKPPKLESKCNCTIM